MVKTPSVTLAKITQPQSEGVLLRERLFQKLDTFRTKPIIWIVGPGGSGKTTLISSYLKFHDLSSLWYQADAGDTDLATFFYYFGLAGKKAAPRYRNPFPLLTPEYLGGIPQFSRNFFGELFRRLKAPSLLVFDNYQEVGEDSPVHEVIIQGLTRMPDEGINIVFVSRSAPTPEFSRFLANGQMAILDWSNLRLSFDECQKIYETRAKENISTTELESIYQWVDGWAAGLLLLLEIGFPARNPDCGTPEGTPQEIFDYFACEVFERQPLDVKEFLFKAAFLPHMTTNMAKKLTENQSAGYILAGLNRHNHFTEKRRQKYITYQFHPLFKEFLQKKALDYYGEDILTGLKRRAAIILQDSDQQEAAVSLFIETEEWQSLIHLILSQALQLVQQGRNQLLQSWIESLPEKFVDGTPWLIYWLAVSRIPFDPKASKLLFEKAFHGFVKDDDRTGLVLAWSGVSEAIYFSFTSFYDYDRWLEVFEEIEEKYTPYPSPEVEIRMVASFLNAVVCRQPYHKDYDKYIDRAAELVETDIGVDAKIQLYHILVLSLVFSRNYLRAEIFIKSFRSYIESNQVPPMALILQRHSEGFCYWQVARFDECRQSVADYFRIGSECGIHLFDEFMLGYAATAAFSEGDLEVAQSYLDKMLTHLDGVNDWAKSFTYTLLSWRDEIYGDWKRAQMHEIKSHEVSSLVGMPGTFGLHKIWRAYYTNAIGEHEKADAYLREAEDFYKEISRKSNIYESSTYDLYLNQAFIYLGRGKEEEGLVALKNFFRVARKHNLVNSYHWRDELMVPICTRALQEGIEVDFVRYFIHKRSLVPEYPLLVGESWPWPIRIYTLGYFEVLMNNKPLRSGRKAQQKPLDLLKVLVALGGRKISHSNISDILWPDDDGDMQLKSLNTTVYRLRKLLENKESIIFNDGLLSLNNRIIWVDTWFFEHYVDEAENLLDCKPRQQQVQQIQDKLFSLYQDIFLPQHTDCQWTIPLREKLRNKFEGIFARFGEYYMAQENLSEALQLFRKLLEINPLRESCYRKIMLCYDMLDQKSEAINIFNTCSRIMKNGLGIEPSKETQQIYNRLLKVTDKN